MIAADSAIVARGMGVRRGGRWLLRPAAFGIAGGVIGLAGPPGVGKSTLLATFATLRRPHVGALEILGFNPGNANDLRSVRARIGYLPDRFSWAENLTVGEFVAYAAYYKRVPAHRGHVIMERLGLGEMAGMDLALLPADVRLRAGLAATCVHEPDLVLLDEPLMGLADDEAENEALAEESVPFIRSLAPTVVVTAPTSESLTGWCDQVFTMARGRLTELPARPVFRGATSAPRRSHANLTTSSAPPRPAKATARTVLGSGLEAMDNREPERERLPVGSGACV